MLTEISTTNAEQIYDAVLELYENLVQFQARQPASTSMKVSNFLAEITGEVFQLGSQVYAASHKEAETK